MVGETEVKERPKSNPDYLMQLMNDRKVMSSLPNFSGIFTHLERLLDEGKVGRTSPASGGCWRVGGTGTTCHARRELTPSFPVCWVWCLMLIKVSRADELCRVNCELWRFLSGSKET